jgi:hypothetical protein
VGGAPCDCHNESSGSEPRLDEEAHAAHTRALSAWARRDAGRHRWSPTPAAAKQSIIWPAAGGSDDLPASSDPRWQSWRGASHCAHRTQRGRIGWGRHRKAVSAGLELSPAPCALRIPCHHSSSCGARKRVNRGPSATNCRPPPFEKTSAPGSTASSPTRRSRHNQRGPGSAPLRSPGWAATDPTGRSPSADTRCAETSAAADKRPDLPQALGHDRDPTREPQGLELLPDPHPGQHRLVLQQPVDLILERIQHRPRRLPPIRRRLIRAQRHTDRVARQPRAPHQPLDRYPAHEMLTAQLRHTNRGAAQQQSRRRRPLHPLRLGLATATSPS